MPIGRKSASGKYVKYNTKIIFIFLQDSPTEVSREWIFTHNGS